jgi:predicted RNA-binding Zn ribbon-like protein
VEFSFVAARPVLDFVATVSERGTTHHDQLSRPQDLAEWVAESGLTDDPVSVTDQELTAAVAVREALFGLVTSLIDRAECRPEHRELVNLTAARSRPVLRLDDSGRVSRSGGLDAVLALLATDCLDLFDGPDRLALHWCAADRCTRPFLDRSRGGRRRWCEMRSCGDRMKAAAYRERQRMAGTSTRPGHGNTVEGVSP